MADGGAFTKQELDLLLGNLHTLSDEETEQLFKEVEKIEETSVLETARIDFVQFCLYMIDDYKVGAHHRKLASLLMDIEAGKEDRLTVSIAPRHGKSMMISELYSCWYMGRNPNHKVMLVSHTTDLAVDFGRKIRNHIATEKYKEVFPGVSLASDSKSAGRWNTNRGGEFFAAGVGSALAGRGAHLLLVDDPHALEVTTPIPTTEGFKEMQDVQVGDYVFGPDGLPTKVTHKSEVYHDRELYSVTTSDGEEILCDSQHLWGVNSNTNLSKAKVYSYSAEYLQNWSKPNRPVIPRHQPVQYPEKDLPIDPWVLGAWLGDGTASSGRITADFKNGDQDYMMGEFRKAGYEIGPVTADGWTFNVYGLMPQLRALGVLNNKHIPEEYLTASVEQRMALLQGLVDTDGSVHAQTGQTGFYNCNYGLVCAVKELLHSLGVKATVRTYLDKRNREHEGFGRENKPNHRVMWKLADSARMPRKRRYCRTPMDKRSRSIEVENTGARGSVQCLTVEREDGLFLCGRSYVVTHNSEQDVLNGNFEVFEKAYQWFTFGARTRLMPGGRVAIVMTRWHQDDLVGRLTQDMQRDPETDQYHVVEFPVIINENTEKEKALWPEFFDLDALRRIKAGMPLFQWNAQFMQTPTAEEAALIKREWWQDWSSDDPPSCEYIIVSLDAAAETHNRADYTSITIWGVFWNDEWEWDEDARTTKNKYGKPTGGAYNIILLNAIKDRMEFPQLKKKSLDVWETWEPDAFIVEKKSAGTALYQEMRRMGLPVSEFTPHRGTGDKVARVNSVSDILSSGMVWAPRHRWAEEVIEECAAFPFGSNDDHVDTTVMALMRFRQGGFITLPHDEPDEIQYFQSRGKRRFY